MNPDAPPNLASTFAAYIPAAVVEWLRSGSPLSPGDTTQFNAAVLLVGFSGLTSLIERFSHDEAKSAEAIDVHVNSILGDLVDCVHKFDGVVARLDGDALVAYLPQRTDLFLTELARRALTCAIEMQCAVRTRSMARHTQGEAPDDARFGLRIGVAYGPLSAIILGDADIQQSFIVGGAALNWAAAGTGRAALGQVIANINVVAPLRNFISGEALDHGQHLVTDLDVRAGTAPLPALDDDEDHWPPWLENALRPFVSPALLSYLADGAAHPPTGYRRAVCMCVNFIGPGYDDPSAGGQLLAYIKQVDAILRRYGGFLDRVRTCTAHTSACVEDAAGTHGTQNQLRVIFDAPANIETVAGRALACALALQRGAFATEHAQCIGVSGGQVFACTLGSAVRRQHTVVGDVVERADGLARQAAPGEVWVDAYIEAEATQAFAFRRLEPEPQDAPVVYRLEGEQSAAGNLAAQYPFSFTRPPIIGRRTPQTAIAHAIDGLRQGRGQIIALVGDAGVGKSRLVEALVTQWLETGGSGYACSIAPHSRHIPFQPWIDIWHAVFGLRSDDDPATAHDKLISRLRHTCPDYQRAAALLGPLLGIAVPTSEIVTPLNAQTRRDCLFDVALDLLIGLTEHGPLVLIFENLHWADASTLALLAHIATGLEAYPILLCLTGRPVERALPGTAPSLDYYNLSHSIRLDLQALTEKQGWALLKQRVGTVDWPPALHAQLERLIGTVAGTARRSTPLFIEEVVNYLSQTGVLKRAGEGYTVDMAAVEALGFDAAEARVQAVSPAQDFPTPSRGVNLPQIGKRLSRVANALPLRGGGRSSGTDHAQTGLSIPDKLDALLGAQIARLDAPATALLQAAAIAGPAFTLSILGAVYPDLPHRAMRVRLDALTEMGFIVNLGDKDTALRTDRFRHIEIAKAARRRLPPELRHKFHTRVAEYLIAQQEADVAQVGDALLAYHYDAGGDYNKAIHHAMRAAAFAQSIYANAEALHHYAIAARNVEQLQYEGERWPLYIQIELNRGRIYQDLGEYTRAEAAVGQALHLATSHRDRQHQTQAFNLIADLCGRQGRYQEAARFAEDAARIAEVSGLEPELVEAWRLMGFAYLYLGRRHEAVRPLQYALDLARQLGDPALITETSATMGIMYAGNYRLIEARDALKEALARVRPTGDKQRIADYLAQLGQIYFRRGEGTLAVETYQEAVVLLRVLVERATDRIMPARLGDALRELSRAFCFEGQYEAAEPCIEEALELFERNNDDVGLARCMATWGRELERDLGRYPEARAHLQAALEELGSSTFVDDTVEAMLALADVQMHMDDLDTAADTLQMARTWIEMEGAWWFWPEYCLVSGHMAMMQSDYTAAVDAAQKGLARISARGDARTLPGIYLLLARALQGGCPGKVAAIHDAFERSMRAARGRARMRDRAISLIAFGRYLRRKGARTSRARGTGFLFEADALFNTMGLTPPPE